jgi:hypothetical protein
MPILELWIILKTYIMLFCVFLSSGSWNNNPRHLQDDWGGDKFDNFLLSQWQINLKLQRLSWTWRMRKRHWRRQQIFRFKTLRMIFCYVYNAVLQHIQHFCQIHCTSHQLGRAILCLYTISSPLIINIYEKKSLSAFYR